MKNGLVCQLIFTNDFYQFSKGIWVVPVHDPLFITAPRNAGLTKSA
jgi:hypothetical protein